MENKSGIELITDERKRQIEIEGWDSEHDDQHTEGELALMACCYASPIRIYVMQKENNSIVFNDPFPTNWDKSWDKRSYIGKILLINNSLIKSARIRNLVKAGALIAAEIDRLQRSK